MAQSIPSAKAGRLGFAAALSAFSMWGLLPLFWKQLVHVPAFEVLAHRIIWTAALTVVVLVVVGQGARLLEVFRTRRQLAATAAASLLISTNGLIFIWAVAEDRVTEVSLGYYINPLLNMLLGMVLLKERPTGPQRIAIGLCAVAVAYLTVQGGGLPWPSLVLAACFSLYGLVRKTAPVAPLVGLAVEMLLASPVAALYLWLGPEVPLGAAAGASGGLWALLVLTGVASALPLWLFATGARKLPYTTVGVLMFIAPSLQLALAVLVYGEPFGAAQAVTFGLIWAAISLYLYGAVRPGPSPRPASRSSERPARAADPG